MIYPVILAGGSGTRLWPLSRELYPKQLIELVDENTMLQDTVLRLRDFEGMADPIVICNENHRFMVAEQLRNIGADSGSIILEPVGRNTAPAVAVAALRAKSDGDDPVLLVLPADHYIRDVPVFHEALATGLHFARQDRLITFGIVPDAPETGYGYIRKGVPLSPPGESETSEAVAIDQFVEKPDPETAESYLRSGNYCWNSGMFMFRASAVLAEMTRHVPDMVSACGAALEHGQEDLDFFRLDRAAFESCPADSIDYAIMEKTDRGAMIPFQAGWNDLGSWEALWQVGEKDAHENVVQGDVLLHDVSHSFLHASTRLVAAVGLENHIVVETADAVLISPRDKVQDVKSLVNKLKAARREETISHKTTYSPWGSSETLVASERFLVKRVTVKPGATLSLQKHFNRAEHWIVLRGTALVTKGEEEVLLEEDRSTYIAPGVAHRLVNPGKIPLEFIEVRSGSYLGEDDIVRLEHVYRE
ncbi:mannose-1-phosphate guanylyltransferase/mannose- 6-phosphate isomerase [Desulfonema ishimotonii]|uniref:mannose-1-phosphate guanylyltransferase n=1 Tax=Desulfonema ishimotonii TaxID=45657 RepID=A0A401FS98_9BACT|nr:mannose-1-phosphate guanylyltransferase/mannose-6-phosphate isomerase [Desulfonema ishimotonii]GBC59836.1 mannose-1-phosphate guanylyltransferase/mannose- 6-phosphate isomerase [Desulfonema ishimotonii]